VNFGGHEWSLVPTENHPTRCFLHGRPPRITVVPGTLRDWLRDLLGHRGWPLPGRSLMPRKPTTKTVVFANGSKSVFNKHGNDEGTVYFQESKNAWRASYVLEGESVRRYVQARTRDQALAKREEAILARYATDGHRYGAVVRILFTTGCV